MGMEVSLGAGRLHLHWGCHWDYRLDGVEGMKYQALEARLSRRHVLATTIAIYTAVLLSPGPPFPSTVKNCII